jgi:autotransporter-associated beta strand protein
MSGLLSRWFPVAVAFSAALTRALAGQGAGAALYAVSNSAFIENPAGSESVVTIDDTSGLISSLQTAINNARSANPNAILVIHLLSGATYSVTNAGLVLGSRECLVAAGATIRAASASVTVPLITVSSGSTNVSIAGGTLDGNGANVNGIYVPAADRVNIDAVTVRNCGLDCILLKGNGNSTYDNELTVTRCDASGSPAHAGISIQNATQAVCVDNRCYNSLVGIYLTCAWGNVGNNNCWSNTTGIDIAGGNDNVVANNTCTNNSTGIHAGGSNHMIVSNSTGNNSTAGINSNGSNNTFIDNVFTAGNTSDFTSAGSGNRVVAYRIPLNAPGQNYFYPPLIDDQHTETIVNGMGRTDLTIGSTTIASVQSQYDAARAANPTNVIVLHLNGTFTVGASPLLLSSNTCVLLTGTIQINGSTTASSAISDNSSPARVSISGGIIDGGNLTGNNGIQFSSSSMLQVDGMTLRNFGPANPRTGGSDVIHLDHGSTPDIVTRCTVNGGSARGIWLQLSGVKSLISDNDVSNVNQDGVDCDSSTSGSVVKFNNCHDLVRYGVFFEQSAAHNLALGNICARTGRGINVYNNDADPRAPTQYNTSACNLVDSNNNGMRNGSIGNTNTLSSHNFAFNNVIINSGNIGIEGDPDGVENYYSQNYLSGNGTAITLSGSETFFNPPDVAANLPAGDNLRWASTASTAWNTNLANWLNLSNSLPDVFQSGDSVLFDDTAGLVSSVTLDLSVWPTTVVNNSSTRNYTISGTGAIGGTASLLKQGASTLTVNIANDFSGTVTILGGTLKAGSTGALGSASGATIINGGTLDVNGLNFTAEPVTASGAGGGGQGAVVNTGPSQTSALRNVTLAGDTTFGGTGRWDIRAASTSSTNGCSLVTLGQPFKLTKVGTNQFSLVAVSVDLALGDIDVKEGVFAVQTATSQLGNSGRTITVFPGATLNLWNLSVPLNKRIVLSNNATIWNESGNSTVVGPVALTNGISMFNVSGTSLTVSNNVISGPGGLTKTGAGILNLRGVNTYTGSTVISAGALALVGSGSIDNSLAITINNGTTLDASGRSDSQLTLAAGQALGGKGLLKGNAAIGNGAKLAPGDSIGTLTFSSNLMLNAGSTTVMEVSKAPLTNDILQVSNVLTYGGTLVVTNISATPLAAGDNFKLFNAGSYTGAFTNFVPAIPALNLAWSPVGLVTGALSVVSSPTPPPCFVGIAIGGNNLVLSGTNGVPGWLYQVLSTTNVALPLSQWTVMATNRFDDNGNFTFTNSPGINMAQQYFLLRMQ